MSRLRLALLACSVCAATPCLANDYDEVSGFTLDVGAARAHRDSGTFIDANWYYLTLFSAALEAKKVGSQRLDAAFLGIGLTPLIQTQIGYGDQGSVYRVRSEFSPGTLFAGEGKSRVFPPRGRAWGNLLTVSFTYERVPAHKELDNYSIGLGFVLRLRE